ncbi:MAG: ornithine cyclodeaminase family protein [Geminicoccaceae bacterium]|nr:ornithine cyclodeaminase family protein [Geminicoccaceae bacterium]
MRLGRELLYLCNADIESLAIRPREVARAVEAMFRAKAEGRATMKPKTGLHATGGTAFLAAAGVLDDPPCAGVKWVGVAENDGTDLPHIAGTILLSDAATGMPLAVLDAAWITGVRTAAITAVCAKHMARPESARIAFVACGLQARTHLAALRDIFPLTRVRAASRRLATAERFADHARSLGLEAEAFADPAAAIRDADIVVTTTPVVPRTAPFLDANTLAPGTFMASVDLGISWRPRSLEALDRIVTDDTAQAGSERIDNPRGYAGEIADLVTGKLQGRRTPEERTALIFAGLGLADVAVAALVQTRARQSQTGRVLPL